MRLDSGLSATAPLATFWRAKVTPPVMITEGAWIDFSRFLCRSTPNQHALITHLWSQEHGGVPAHVARLRSGAQAEADDWATGRSRGAVNRREDSSLTTSTGYHRFVRRHRLTTRRVVLIFCLSATAACTSAAVHHPPRWPAQGRTQAQGRPRWEEGEEEPHHCHGDSVHSRGFFPHCAPSAATGCSVPSDSMLVFSC